MVIIFVMALKNFIMPFKQQVPRWWDMWMHLAIPLRNLKVWRMGSSWASPWMKTMRATWLMVESLHGWSSWNPKVCLFDPLPTRYPVAGKHAIASGVQNEKSHGKTAQSPITVGWLVAFEGDDFRMRILIFDTKQPMKIALYGFVHWQLTLRLV